MYHYVLPIMAEKDISSFTLRPCCVAYTMGMNTFHDAEFHNYHD